MGFRSAVIGFAVEAWVSADPVPEGELHDFEGNAILAA
jgi:hypothetical protein